MHYLKGEMRIQWGFILLILAGILFLSLQKAPVDEMLIAAEKRIPILSADSSRKNFYFIKLLYPDSITALKADVGIVYTFLKEEKLDSARLILDKNLHLSQSYPEIFGKYLHAMGLWYLHDSAPDSSKLYFNKALNIYSGSNFYSERMKILNELAKLNIDDYQLKEAKTELKTALGYLPKLRPSLIDSNVLIVIYMNLGAIYFYDNQLDSSVFYYERSLQIANTYLGPNHARCAQNIVNIAMVKEERGYYTDALLLYEKALEIYKNYFKKEEHPLVAEAYGNIGNIYLRKRDFEKALYYFNKDRVIITTLYGEDDVLAAFGWHNAGTVELARKNFTSAVHCFDKALEIRLKHFSEEHYNVTQSQIQLANAHLELRNIVLATQYAEAALNSLNEKNTLLHADALMALGKIKLFSKRNAEADAIFSQALSIYQKLLPQHHPDISAAFLAKAKCYNISQQLTKAFLNIDKAIEAALSEDGSEENNSEINAKNVAFEMSFLEAVDYKLSLYKDLYAKDSLIQYLDNISALCKMCIPVIDKTKRLYSSDDALNDVYPLAAAIYETGFFSVFMKYKQRKETELFDEALLYSELLKDNQQQLLSQGLDAFQIANIPEKTLRREYQLKKDIQYYKSLVADYYNDTTVFNALEFNKIQEHLTQLFSQQENFYKNLERFHPDYYKLKYAQTFIDRHHIQKHALNKRQRFLSYVLIHKNAYIISIDRDQFEILQTTLPDAESSINEQLQNLSFHKMKADMLFGLTNALFPDEVIDRNIQQYVIIPDGFIRYLPLEGLRKNARYLIQDFAFMYSPSATVFGREKQSNELLNNTVLAFAPENFSSFGLPALPASIKEVKDIDQYFSAKVYTGKNATESVFKNKVKENGFLHLATHAEVDHSNPLKSRIYFAADSSNDGVLYAYELYGLPMRVKLATLSACATGDGLDKGAQGFQSIANAFVYNGCSNVLMCLWPVSDKVAGFIMDRFYYHLSKGESKDVALQLAKTDYLAQADRYSADPYYWAGFVLQGDSEPLPTGIHQLRRYWWVPPLILLMIALFYDKRWWMKWGR